MKKYITFLLLFLPLVMMGQPPDFITNEESIIIKTNKNGVFSPSVATSSGRVRWEITGNTAFSGNNLFYSFTDSTVKTVKLQSGNMACITGLWLISNNIIETLDLKKLKKLNTLTTNDNPDLTGIVFPLSTEPFSLTLGSCNLTGTLDLSSLTKLKSTILLNSNRNLTQVIFPHTPELIEGVGLWACNITGTLDLQELTNFTGHFQCQNNINLTEIKFPYVNQRAAFYGHMCNLTGILDLSNLPKLFSFVILFQNPNLTQVIFPNTNEPVDGVYINNCNLTGTLDLTGLANFTGYVYCPSNPNLTKIKFPITNQPINICCDLCDLTDTLDLSNLSKLSGVISLQLNSNLTKIIFPETNEPITDMYLNNCNLTGTLDLSNLTDLKKNIYCFNNPNLNNILFPVINDAVELLYLSACNIHNVDFTKFTADNSAIYITLFNNSMNATEVDQVLIDLDSKGWINGLLYIGGNNAAPTAIGITAKENLVLKGWTVSVTL